LDGQGDPYEVNNLLKKKQLTQIKLSTIQREVAAFRRKNREGTAPILGKGVDRPWSISTLEKYPISGDSLRLVFECYRDRLDRHIQNRTEESVKQLLTIREAKWMGRLYPVVSSLIDKETNLLESLAYWAYRYADFEQCQELSDVEIDSHELDNILIQARGKRDPHSLRLATGFVD
jgi:hypothetical protein